MNKNDILVCKKIWSEPMDGRQNCHHVWKGKMRACKRESAKEPKGKESVKCQKRY